MKLDGKRVLLTGATGGLGRAIATALAERGATILLSSRKADELVELASSLPGEGHRALVADLALEGAAERLVGDAGEVDILVANARACPPLGGPARSHAADHCYGRTHAPRRSENSQPDAPRIAAGVHGFRPLPGRRKVRCLVRRHAAHCWPAYQAAVQLGKSMANNGWFVVTGAATGIMEAGHRGAGRERSMGINITLPFEQAANEIILGDVKLVTMKYFFTRKLMFVKECDAVVCLPGGFGTMDEAFEVLTLLQTGKRELMPLVFLDAPGGSYWHDRLSYVRKHLLAGKMISPEDLSLFRVTESVEETVDEILRFYHVFAGMEYVDGRLVLRLQERISEAHLAAFQPGLRRHSWPMAISDRKLSRQADSANGIAGERARLIFHFNRRSLGRLRQLLDTITARRDSCYSKVAVPPQVGLP